ncbi:tripartite tricarboxylate transporter permease [Xanthobacter pseudotagetidis]|uniref:tripartite tricarboxylate transporter permease n=1 Tax=Xanthobacter pseudotagetidis TaxID=3119911 RepID=UPI00372D7DFF
MGAMEAGIEMVLRWDVILTILAASVFGLIVGAIPGLTATMAIALLVPITFFMEPLPAVGAMIACSAMAIFAGDIPSTLMRMPGTPASAAYTEECYAMTRKGQAEIALGANVLFSALGGLFGTVILILAAPLLAEVALGFSSFEYFWLALLGLACAIFIGSGSPVKGMISLLLGLFVAQVGIDNPGGLPRFTFGSTELLGGIDFIPAMIGLFAMSEVIRTMATGARDWNVKQVSIGNPLKGWGAMFVTYWRQQIRGNLTGTAIGILPGAGADIAAWVSYATSRKFSKQPEKFGTGHVEGIIESTSSNNAALAGAWVPALVFGIPGDSITAVVIGVLYLKGLNPGPMLFVNNPQTIYAVFTIFILANLLMIPLGLMALKAGTALLRFPRRILIPIILMFCIVGSYAVNNSGYGVVLMLVFGVLGFLMEEHEIPVAPCVLGIVLGKLLEESFVTSMIKADGNLLAFFERPISGTLGVLTILVFVWPIWSALKARRRERAVA